MKVIAYNIGRAPAIEDIQNTQRAMQEYIGGHIEIVPVTPDIILICNATGKIKRLPASWARYTRGYPDGLICGNFFCCRAKGKNFADAWDTDIIELGNYILPAANCFRNKVGGSDIVPILGGIRC